MYYTLGSDPSDSEISTLYGRYFSRFNPGQSVPVPYNDISASAIVDVDSLNRIIVHTLFNLDVIYEAYHEQVQDLYDINTSLLKRLENIRTFRVELEKKVDDQLFALTNTDGFYYAVTNAFNDLSLTDINYTTAFVNTAARKVTIPKLNSGLFNYIANTLNTSASSSVDVIFEGQKVKSDNVDFSNVFNGLINSEWIYKFESTSIGLCTLKISIPISGTNDPISLVEGKIKSQKPVDIGLIVINPNNPSESISFTKSGSSDYDNFSYQFSPQSTNAVELYLTKSEPDYVTRDSNNSVIYNYDFRIDELIISSPYFDSSATIVSKPISLPSQNNSKLTIDAVSISADESIPSGSEIRYYIAPDNPSATNVYDYTWTAISPSNIRDPKNPVVINFNGSNKIQATLESSTTSDIVSTTTSFYNIPRSSTYNNPISNYFYNSDSSTLGFNVYRLCKFPQGVKPYDSYILENVDKNQLTVNLVTGYSLDKNTWQQVLTGQRSDIVYTSFNKDVSTTSVFFSTGDTVNNTTSLPYGSIYMSTNIYSETDMVITEKFLKSLSAQYWDIEIYLNGVHITSNGVLAPGVLSASVTWKIKKGQNDLVMIINKSTNDTNGTQTGFSGSISILDDKSILSINGLKLYKNYLYEVKIEDLRLYYSNNDNVYSIINYENNYEIVYRRTEEIKNGSKIYYYYNTNNSGVESIRIRADLFRGNSYNSAPSINSYTVKFKH